MRNIFLIIIEFVAKAVIPECLNRESKPLDGEYKTWIPAFVPFRQSELLTGRIVDNGLWKRYAGMTAFLQLSLIVLCLLVPLRSVWSEVTIDQVRDEIQKALQNSNKPTSNPNVFNPAMGLVLDAVASHTTLKQSDFEFRSLELNLQAAIDPFANLYGVINGTPNGVGVEEAFFMTTSLPYVTIRGGRMFANFGRLPHWHDHELPFVNRTPSLANFVGGESQADGVELMHLFGTPFFLQGTLGAYNKIGADNTRLEATTGSGNTNGRSMAAFTYLARLFSYAPLGDNYGFDMGLSEALTPRANYIDGTPVDLSNSNRSLTGADVTFRFEPLANNVYRKLIWGTEVFRNSELQQETDSLGAVSYPRKTAWGGYSYIDWRFARLFSTGPFYDYAENLSDPSLVTRTGGAMLNYILSEFQRVRFQISRQTGDQQKTDNQFYLQYFATIGTHVHVFKDR